MQVNSDIIWSAVTTIVVGITLKSTEVLLNRKKNADDILQHKVDSYQTNLEEEVAHLREENRRLREEADKYRAQFLELSQKYFDQYGQKPIDKP